MALTPIFWARVWKNHGYRGLFLALTISFIISAIFYILYYLAIPEMFDLSVTAKVFLGYLMMAIVLILFFVLYWKLVVKKKK